MPRSEFAPLVDALVDGLVVITSEGIMVRANAALCELFGYEESELLGENVSMLMTPEDAPHHNDYLKNYLESGQGKVIGIGREVTGRHSDGTSIPLELAVSPAEINDQPMFVGFLRDITERKEAEAEIRRNNKIMRAVNNALTNVINEGMSTREVFDRALEDLLEVTGSEYGFIGEILHEGQLPYLKTHAITNIAWNRETRAFYRDNVTAGLEFRNLDSLFGVTIRSGQMVIANHPHTDPRRGGLPKGHPSLDAYLGVPIYSGARMLGMAGVANRADGYSEDLVEQIKPLLSALGTMIATHQNTESRIKAEEALFRTQQQLKQMATKDPVTGMANRYLLVQELEAAYERRRSDEDLSILFIDVDRFKSVNDNYGHDLGDKVLKHMAQMFEKAIRPNDILGRYGGEEFLVGLPGCAPENAAVIAERMRKVVADSSFSVDEGSTLRLSISIGVAAMSHKPGNLEELIHFADQSVYAAKDAGRNCVHVYGEKTARKLH